MSAQPARGYLGISEVLAQLRGEFPDVSVSKIRFLETEGLIAPARSPSGYRRFGSADVDRLRYILAAQRDQYLPLRVIKERLARRDPDGADPELSTGRLLTRRELVAAAGLTEALCTELETFGLLRRVGRQYGAEALQVARAAAALSGYGVEARHLRSVRAAAERETTMIEGLVAPILRQRGSGARELAARTAAEITDVVLRLHAALVDAALAEAGLSLAPEDTGGAGADQESASGNGAARPAGRGSGDAAGLGRGVAGASA